LSAAVVACRRTAMSEQEQPSEESDAASEAVSDGTALDYDDTDSLPTEAAFKLLADETRLDIIRALGDTGPEGDPLTFSELRDRVGVRDSGQFNYHLDKILGEFVRQTDDGDAYEITYAGVVVYQTLVRGTFDHRVEVAPFDTGIDCHECPGSYEASYSATSLFTLECPDCESRLYFAHFPPRGLEERTRAEFLEAVDQWIRKDVTVFARGLCPFCSGDVDTSLVLNDEADPIESGLEPASDAPAERENSDTALPDRTQDDHHLPRDERPLVGYVRYNCRRCKAQIFSTIGMHLLSHPAVVSFYDDHGIDLRREPLWDIDFAASSGNTSLRSRDPPRVVITVEAGDDRLGLVLDETASVIERDRS
jgi:DNA-binding transcriptional ArsR family regulator